MSNLYFTLPVPVGNGIGAAVDVSAMGALKTVVVVGSAVSTLNIEFNNDPAQAGSWQTFATIMNSGAFIGYAAVRWMRVRVSGFNPNVGGTSSVHIGGTDDGTQFAALPVAGGNAAGAPVDVSALPGTFKTVHVGGEFRGSLSVEVSEDGTTEWAQPFSFGAPGAQSMVIVARWMRTRRTGVPAQNPGIPVVNVGFAFPQASAPGTGITVQFDGVPIAGNPHDTLNVVGPGIVATDGGGGVADVAVTGAVAVSTVHTSNVVIATAPQVVRVDPTGGTFNVTLPSAALFPGVFIVLKNVSDNTTVVVVLPDGADTIDGDASVTLSAERFSLTLVSDGVSDWLIVG